MTFKQTPAPYQRGKKTTLQIMMELTIALAVIWLTAVVYTFMKAGTSYGIRSILLMVISVATTLLCDVLVTVLRNKKNKELLKLIPHDIVHSYSWVTAMIFTLCCPVWTRYYVIVVGSIFATVIGKHVFGGFGKNIFNPAAIGRIFIMICFGNDLNCPTVTSTLEDGTVVTSAALASGVDATTGSTVTSIFSSSQGWLGSNAITGYSALDLISGNYFAAMGETFTALILVLGIVLILRRDMNWRAPVFYLGTVTVSALCIGLVLGFNNPLLYVLYHLSLGGVMFGAIFMISDPVTTPTSQFGNCLVGVIAGMLTVLIRVGTNWTEGVVYSLVIINLITPMIDGIIKGKSNARLGAKYGVTFGTAALAIALSVGMAWSQNGGREVYQINGIAIEKYNAISEHLNFSYVNDNGYTYAPYTKDLTTLSEEQQAILVADEENGYEAAYSIYDKKKNEVGVVYCVKTSGKTIEIMTEPPYSQKKSATLYVAFDIASKQVMGITFVTTPYVGAFQSKVENGFADYDYANNNILTAEPNTIVSGATYSATGVQTLLNTAYGIFTSQYGA